MEGTNALTHLAGDWTPEQRRMNIAQLQRTKTFMPPFSGTPEELEALAALIEWTVAGKPREWDVTTARPGWAEGRRRIRAWLDEVGTAPGFLRPKGTR
jgi:hypothetical protein